MKLPRRVECLLPPRRGNVNNRLRPEKVLSSCFRTGVRFPSAPPCKNAIPFGMAFLHGCAEGREKPSGSTDWISRRVNAAILRFAQNQKGNPVDTEAAKPPEYSPRLHPATERLPSQGSCLRSRLRGCHKFAIASCLRRPHLFSRKRKDGGEKSAWMRLVRSASEFR